MNPIPMLAVAEMARIPFTDTLPHLVGLLMVMATLATLWGVCTVTAQLVRIFLPGSKTEASLTVSAVAAPAPPAASERDGEIAPEILAVIAAAVAATIGKSHRVVSIKPMSSSWERAGRQSVLTSHHIR